MKKPFETIVVEHGSTVLRVCRATVGPTDADDAWSETFIAALRAYPELPGDANIEAWLVTIAHRKAIDIVRGRNRRAIPVGELPEAGATDVLLGDEDQELWNALRSLSPKQRQVIAYHFVAGLPYAEVARILGGSPAAARRASADGMKNLRAHYRPKDMEANQ